MEFHWGVISDDDLGRRDTNSNLVEPIEGCASHVTTCVGSHRAKRMANRVVETDAATDAVVGGFTRGACCGCSARVAARAAIGREWVTSFGRFTAGLHQQIATVGQEADTDAVKIAQAAAHAAGGAVGIRAAAAEWLASAANAAEARLATFSGHACATHRDGSRRSTNAHRHLRIAGDDAIFGALAASAENDIAHLRRRAEGAAGPRIHGGSSVLHGAGITDRSRIASCVHEAVPIEGARVGGWATVRDRRVRASCIVITTGDEEEKGES